MVNKIVPKNKLLIFIVFLSLLSLVLAGCKSKNQNLTPTGLAPDAINTAAVQTADARRNMAGSLTPTSVPLPTFDTTAIAITQAAATLQAQVTPSPIITPTLAPTSQGVTPTLTPALPTGQDNSVFTFKETIPDDTKFNAGEQFTKTWQFMNTGQTTWITTYSLAFVNGEKMGGPESVPLEIEVLPGRLVDISVQLTAPANPGTYRGYWRLRNSAGQVFGEQVYIQIEVKEQNGAGFLVIRSGME